jgi:DNA (cytosine-5)-methyltransferase 1
MPLEVVDLFCGAGGTSTGILEAITQRMRRKVQLTAVNHWRTAVNSHSLNHPGVRHLCENVENVHPLDLIPSGDLDLLAASCECRFHSNARGGGPCNEQSRSQPWQLIRWATDINVANILMENVREFMNWGPLNKRTKRPIQSKRGQYFKSFVNALINLGYVVEFKVQVAADYGDPTSRPRLMLLARKGNEIIWPEPSHGPGRAQPWRTARECIDWDLKGKSIFERAKPLCKNTMRRIAAGLKKFGGTNAEPFLILLRGTSDRHIDTLSARSVDQPLPTLTAGGGHLALCEPFIIGAGGPTYGAKPRSVDQPLSTVLTQEHKCLVEPFITAYHNGERLEHRNHSIDQPLPTQDTSNRFALVEPIIVQTDQQSSNGACSRSLDQPLGTVVSKQSMLLVEPMIVKYYGKGSNFRSVDEPIPTITGKQRFALVEFDGRQVQLDIRTRMLQPHELSAAHSFPKAYKFTGNKEDQTKQIGNSVPVQLAAAHAHAALS